MPPVPTGKCKLHGVDNVGTVPAAVTAYLAVQALAPDVVVSAGTAGGFASRGAAIADVYLATGYSNHDRRIPMEAFDKYGVWAFDAHPAPRLAAAAGLKQGPVSTGNSFDACPEDLAGMAATGAAVKEMEAAGIVWATHLFDVPLLALKSVTDTRHTTSPPAHPSRTLPGMTGQAQADPGIPGGQDAGRAVRRREVAAALFCIGAAPPYTARVSCPRRMQARACIPFRLRGPCRKLVGWQFQSRAPVA